MFDKFGEEGVEKYYKTLYLIVYRLRIEKEQVRFTSVADYPVATKIFNTIEKAKSYADLSRLDKLANKKVLCKKDAEPIIRYFIKQNIKLESGDIKKFDPKKYNLA